MTSTSEKTKVCNVVNEQPLDVVKLVIMRHGEAESFQVQDDKRCLTNWGKKEATLAGKWLAEYFETNGGITLALVSHYSRAQQSYQQLCPEVVIQDKQDSSDVLPDSSPQLAHDYIKVLIADNPGLKSIIVVSHMPFISYFLEEIHEKNESMLFETSSIAIIDYKPLASSGNLACVYHPN